MQRVDLGDGVSRFERADPRGDHHHHLVCGDCGKVEPFEDPALEAAIERVAGGRGTRWPRTTSSCAARAATAAREVSRGSGFSQTPVVQTLAAIPESTTRDCHG